MGDESEAGTGFRGIDRTAALTAALFGAWLGLPAPALAQPPDPIHARTGVTCDPNAQPDARIRASDSPPARPGQHREVWCSKIGRTIQDVTAAVSVRENERGARVGNGWDPQWHEPSHVFTTYSDKDFRLPLNAARTTLATVGRHAGAARN